MRLSALVLIFAASAVGLGLPRDAASQEKTYPVEIVPKIQHSAPVWSVAYSPDGRTIISGSASGDIKLWDAATGMLLRTLQGHGGIIRSAVFSPDGRDVLSSERDGAIKLWDGSTGLPLRTFFEKPPLSAKQCSANTSASFSPDGQRVITTVCGTMSVFDASSGRVLHTYSDVQGNEFAFWITASKVILNGSDTFELRDVDTGMVVRIPRLLEADPSSKLAAFVPGGHTVIYYKTNKKDALQGFELRDLSGGLLHTFDLDPDMQAKGYAPETAGSVTFSRDGRSFAFSSIEGTLKLWDLASGKETRSFEKSPEILWRVR